MKHISKPAAIRVGEGATALPYTCDAFLTAMINVDQRFNASGAGIRASVRIEAALKASADLPVLSLEESDWTLLVAALREPSTGYPVMPARILLPFIDAVEAADAEVSP